MIILPAQLEGIRTRKDRTLHIGFGTQELDPSKAGAVMALSQQLCYLAIKPDAFNAAEADLIDNLKADIELTAKTPAQRLRGVLFRLWEQQGVSEDFPIFYEREMHRITEHYKTKLDG